MLSFPLGAFLSFSFGDIFKLYFVGVKVAVKAMQKGRIQDYEAFKNEISILK